MKEQAILIFLKLCGAPLGQAASVSSANLTLRHGGALGWTIALTLALGVLTWWSYRRDTKETVSSLRRGVLTGWRTLLFALLLLLMLQPMLTFTAGTDPHATVDAELWSSPAYFLLIVLVASTEWALRKRWQLK